MTVSFNYYRLAKVILNKHLDDSFKSISHDNVYPMRYYRWPVYTAEEAIKAHQETHHPTMYNEPEAYVYARVEMNMEGVKKVYFHYDMIWLQMIMMTDF